MGEIKKGNLLSYLVSFQDDFDDFEKTISKMAINVSYESILDEISFYINKTIIIIKENSVFYEYKRFIENKVDQAFLLLNACNKLLDVDSSAEGSLTYKFSYEIGLQFEKNLKSILNLLKVTEEKLTYVLQNDLYLRRIDALVSLRKALNLLWESEELRGKVNKIIKIIENNKHILYLGEESSRKLIIEINNFKGAMFPNEYQQEGLFLDKFLEEAKATKADNNNSNGNVNTFYYDLYSFYKVRLNITEESSKLENLLRDMKNNFINEVKGVVENRDETTRKFENNVKQSLDVFNNKSSVVVEEIDRVELRLKDVESKIFSIRSDISKDVESIKENAKNKIDAVVVEVEGESDRQLKDLKLSISRMDEEIENYKEIVSDKTTEQLTSVYKREAFWEKCAYYIFSAIGFFIIIIAIFYSGISLSNFSEVHIGEGRSYNNLDLIYLSIRLIFSLIIFSSVAFTSKLASKSYFFWKKNEGIYLRLTALKPFISAMPNDKKVEIHEKLIDVYFGKDEQEQNLNQKLNDLPNNITQLLGKVVEQTSVVLDASKATKKEVDPSTDRSNI